MSEVASVVFLGWFLYPRNQRGLPPHTVSEEPDHHPAGISDLRRRLFPMRGES